MHTIDINISINERSFTADLSSGISLSLSVKRDASGVNAYYIPDARFEPFRLGNFVGSVDQGGPCNCEHIVFCAHGNGTHTESVAHVSKTFLPAHLAVSKSLMICKVISIEPKIKQGDKVISLDSGLEAILTDAPEALVIRTLPNLSDKMHQRYSGTNPCYFDPLVTEAFRKAGVKHLLFDQPSVDREEDGGLLSAHKAFFYEDKRELRDRTITELIYVPPQIKDGWYLLQLGVAQFDSDAAPSNPVVFPLTEKK